MADNSIQKPVLREVPLTETVPLNDGFGGVEQSPVIPERTTERQEAKSELLYQKIIAQVQTNPTDDTPKDETMIVDAKHIASLEDVQAQVEQLTKLAELKGVVYAVQVARTLDFYVLDQVHDQLANHFYEKLVSQGMIEKE